MSDSIPRIADRDDAEAFLDERIGRGVKPGLERINNTGRVIAGAMPLLYGMAEGIVVGVDYVPTPDAEPVPARPAMKRRRTRLAEAVGYRPDATT